jgi:pyruvate dehydrogenase E1 component alpha subunit/2-oxoisovalerate dehydrogenase E1 component alpha subunit
VDKATGYGVEGYAVDGTELSACLNVVGGAVARARAGHGPQLVVARLLRLCGHGEHDDASYIDPQLRQSPVGRDCLKVAEEKLLKENWNDPKAIETWRNEAVRTVEDAIATVQREPAPDPFKEDWCALAAAHLSEGRERQP